MKKNIKIGIINHWMVNNYGAVLLAYALERKITEMGYDVETITWLPDEVRKPWKLSMIKKIGIVNYILRIGYFTVFIIPRQISFKNFRRLFNNSKENYVDKSLPEIDKKYDKIIIGGDQLWNCKINYYNENNFLPFVKESKKKVVYAASLSQDEMREDFVDDFRKLAEDFSYITTRENRAKEIIEEITDKKAPRITDSAFLLSKEEWRKISHKPKTKCRYIFVYQVQSDVTVIDYAKMLSKKTGCKIVYCPFPLKKQISCKRKPYMSIEDWLGYIDNAEYVVTDAFHGLVFSIIFNKEFWVEISEYGKDTGSRITNLLDVYSLQERLMNNKAAIDLINLEKIDYSSINDFIKQEQVDAERMITEMLSIC